VRRLGRLWLCAALLAPASGLSPIGVAEHDPVGSNGAASLELDPVGATDSHSSSVEESHGVSFVELRSKEATIEANVEAHVGRSGLESYLVVPPTLQSKAMWPLAVFIPLFLWIATSDHASIWLVIPAWVFGGILMNIVNKVAAVIFPESFLLVLLQMSFAIVFLLLVEMRKMTCNSWLDVAKWMVVPFLFSGILATSLLSFKKASLSTVMICRNVLPFITFSIEKVFQNTPATVSGSLMLSMISTLAGVVLYSVSQSKHAADSSEGMLLVYINALFCACDRLCQSNLLKSNGFGASISFCLLLNNLVGMVPILMLAVATGETQGWHHALTKSQPITWLWVSLSCCCGFCLGYLGLKTQRAVTATTSLMLQNIVKVLLIFVGVMCFGDVLDMPAMAGCSIAIVGGLWYGFLRLPAETRSEGIQAKGKADP